MNNEKKYFWFKMEDDFFHKKEIKKLRSIAGGDTFVIIYLKIILLSLKTGGKLFFEGIDDSFAEEIALEIDEVKENVGITLEYLLRHSAVLQVEENEYRVNISNLIGSETSTAIRVRKHREKNKMLQCNIDVTPLKQNDNGELELNIDLNKEIDKEIDNKPNNKHIEFIAPTIDQIKSYVLEKKYSVDINKFFDYYTETGWKDKDGKKVKNWRLKIITWSNNSTPDKKTYDPIDDLIAKHGRPLK